MASKWKAAATSTVPTAEIFRKLAETEKPFVLPGVHDGLSARLAELAGFRGVFMGGFASLGARHAVPDVGLMGLADISAIARDVRAATSLPFMVDADDGYGDAKNVIHTVRTYERLGAQAIFLEDQVSPKRCGHLAGKRIVSADRMVTKIRAAAAERSSLFIVARTDARSVAGMDEALRRGELYLRAGADAIYIESPESVAELEQCGTDHADAHADEHGPRVDTAQLFLQHEILVLIETAAAVLGGPHRHRPAFLRHPLEPTLRVRIPELRASPAARHLVGRHRRAHRGRTVFVEPLTDFLAECVQVNAPGARRLRCYNSRSTRNAASRPARTAPSR